MSEISEQLPTLITNILFANRERKKIEILETVTVIFQDKLYRYMEERYLVTDIMYLCTFDFINSVIKYADTDKVSIFLSSS